MAFPFWPRRRRNSTAKAAQQSGNRLIAFRKTWLRLEALEDRTVPSTFTQDFSGSGTQFAGNQDVNTFLGDSFDASASFGSIHHVPLLGNFGATAQMDIGGQAGLDLTFSGTDGGVSSAFNATLNQNFAQPNRFGQFVNFTPSNTFVNVNSGNFSTTSPSFGYGANLDLGLHGSIGGEFEAFSEGGGGHFSFDGNLSVPLMSVNENNSGVVNLLGIPIVGASPGLGLNGTMQKAVGALENFILGNGLYYGISEDPPLRVKLNLTTPQALQFVQDLQLQLGVPKQLGPYTISKDSPTFKANLGLDLGSLTEQAPSIDLSSSQLQANGLLTSTGRSNVAQLSIQAGALAGYLLGVPELSALADTVFVNLGPFNVGFTPLSFQIQPTLFASQTATVEPVSQLTYNFTDSSGDPLGVIVKLNGSLVNGGNAVTSVTFTPGKDTLGLDFAGQPVTVTPTWTFAEQLHNQVDLKAGMDGLLKVGEFSVHVPGLGDRDFGPLYQKSFHFVDTTLQSLFDQTTTISSTQVPLPSFTIGGNFHLSTAVTTFADSASQGSGSLRFAVLSANTLASTDPVVIQLGTGTYNLTIHPGTVQDGSSGDIAITAPNLIIVGNGSGNTTINAAGLGDRLFHVKNGAHVKLVGVKLIGGSASDDNFGIGGGIFQDSGSSLELDDSLVTGNSAASDGGGIHSQGSLTIVDSTISNNTVGAQVSNGVGGGVAVESGTVVIQGSTLSGNSVSNSTDAYGGGLFASHSTTTIDSSTISGNTADGETTGSTGQAHGGGVFVEFGGTTLILNSTIYLNHVISGAGEGFGGGISEIGPGTGPLYLIGDTIDSNTVGGNIGDSDSGIEAPFTLVMKNTIVSNNDMFFATVLSGGNNLIENAQQGFAIVNARHNLQFSNTGVPSAAASGWDPTDIVGTFSNPVDPHLGTFGNNGGTTQTLPLLSGSPAIDAGGNTFAIPTILDQLPATDQRGLPRIVNATTDIGAVEYQYDLLLIGNASLSLTTQQITYSYTVFSRGPDPADGVTLTLPIPEGESFLSATAPAGWTPTAPSPGATSGTVTFALNSGTSLTQGQSASFSVSMMLTARPAAPITATASINSAPWDSNPGSNQATNTIFPEGLPFTNTVLGYFFFTIPGFTAGDFSASINWGDGSSNTTTDGKGAIAVVANPLGGFNFVGSHTFAEAGNYGATISAQSTDGQVSILQVPNLVVADQALSPFSPVGSIPPPALILDTSLTNTVLYHFVDPDLSLTASNFQATVYWGDGTHNQTGDTSNRVQVVADSEGGFDVLGTYSYGSTVKGALPAVRVVDANGLVLLNPVLFHFTDGNPLATAADFTATVAWGDGTTGHSSDSNPSVFIIANPSGGFDVLAAHVYTENLRGGTLQVTVQDAEGARALGSGRVEVDFPLTAGDLTMPSVQTEGDSIQNALLFHFTDGDPMGQASDFQVTVLWGDGTDSQTSGSASVVANTNGGFDVYGTHVYGEVPVGAKFGVVVNDLFGAMTGGSSTFTTAVADPAVVATGETLAAFTQGSAMGPIQVATFTDPGGAEDVSDYSADINWGDGTGTQPGTIVAGSGGQFAVLGSHLYTQIGAQSVTVTIHHEEAPDAQAFSTTTVSDPSVAAQGGASLTGNEGTLLTNQLLATFTDPGGADGLGNYDVTIDWGDGTSTLNAPVSVASTMPLSFVSHQPVGQGPVAVGAADFNGDGQADLAIANALDQSVQIALGNGDGTFQLPQTYALGVRPAWLAVGDLNGDNSPDVVIADPSTNSISVLLNSGTGTLGAATTYGTGTNGGSPVFVALADVNGDGNLDAIAANSAGDTVSVFLGNGDGTFQAATVIDAGGQGPSAVAVGDVNGDHSLDLVVADSESGQVSVILGNGDGTFQAAQTLAVGDSPVSVALADLRGNGHLDIIAADQIVDVTSSTVTGNVSVLLGNGDGTFQAAVNYAVGNGPTSVIAADVTGDGQLDLIAANSADNTVSVLAGNGDGTFQAATAHAVGSGPSAVIAADVNGDGTAELITADTQGDTVSLLLPTYTVVGSHAYADNGSYTITVTIENAGGNSSMASSSATIANVAPTATIQGLPATGHSPEGTTLDLNANVSDPSSVDTAAGFTYAWTVTKNGAAFASGTTSDITFTPDDNGTYVVTLTATDKDGAASQPATATITVDNVAPTPTITGAPATGHSPEGTAITLGGSATDPSSVDTAAGFTFAWTVTKNGVAFASGTSNGITFTPDDNGTYVVTLTATDKDGGASSPPATATITVDNVAPTAAITGAPASGHGPEGTAITLGSSATDPSSVDTAAGFTYAWTVTKNGAQYQTGTGSGITFTPDDNGTFVVTLTATDKDGGVSQPATATITVDNVTPIASVSGPSLGVRGQTLTFTLTAADPSSVDQAAGFTFSVDWGDGSTQTVTGPFGMTLDHVYQAEGNYTVSLTATDKDGATSNSVTQAVAVATVGLETDPIDPSKTALVVGGTDGDDLIIIKPVATNGTLNVRVNGMSLGNFHPTGHLFVYAQAGNDDVNLDEGKVNGKMLDIAVPALVFGGDGNDALNSAGSSATNVLEGGAGDDTIQCGTSDRNIMIGGTGADVLHGGTGDDILIGGTTVYDNNMVALGAIVAEWGRTDLAYLDRINHLNGSVGGGLNGTFLLTTATVLNDTGVDTLYGTGGMDWFFALMGSDEVKDQTSGEVITWL